MKLGGCIVWHAHDIVFGSKGSAYGGTPKSRTRAISCWDGRPC